MRAKTTLSILTALTTLTAAASTSQPSSEAATISSFPTNFYLVTTTQRAQDANSSCLANVNATSLFDPYNQQAYLVRWIERGYNSLPTFNLTDGTLHTIAYGILGHGTYEYNTTEVERAGDLQFLPSDEKKGGLGLKEGYLLTVAGHEVGWTVCDGALNQEVLSWKGNDTSCKQRFVHAVPNAPY